MDIRDTGPGLDMGDPLVPMDLDTLVHLETIHLDHRVQDSIQDMVHTLDPRAGMDKTMGVKADHHPRVHQDLPDPDIQVCLLSPVCVWVDQDICQVRKDHILVLFLVITTDHSSMVPL